MRLSAAGWGPSVRWPVSNRDGPSSPGELGALRAARDGETARAALGLRQGFSGKRLVQLGVVLVLMLSAVGVLTAWKMYTMIRTAPGAMLSPDRTMVAVQEVTDSHGHPETHMRVAVEIRDATTGAVIFRRQTRASALRRWDVGWMGNDRLTLLSTEIGRLMWVRGEDGAWRDGPGNADGEVIEISASSLPARPAAGTPATTLPVQQIGN